ncbi:V-type ATP synthase subunit I [Methanobacterium aggregans]|uniref:V-type ATP synthase subunit I n=1 Tax=Methanobacterium aggregans TaxID=1615586 RepID=UPI001AE9C8AF|nr:V-type ATP synthase subunit I [Methanobacterium aggregans]MBP2046195.1 V/A-type H+-transporting ATPase subunit I [Methanobacterium aggregans]
MFKPAKMQKLKIITLDKYADSAVNSLHEEGIVQIQDISERIQTDAEWKQILKPSKANPNTGKVSSLLMKTSGMVDFLESVEKRDGGIKNTIMGFINPETFEKREVEVISADELVAKAESTIADVESRTKSLEEQLNKLDSEKGKLEDASKIAEELKDFDVDLIDLKGSEYTEVITGKIELSNLEKFKEEASAVTEEYLVFETDSELKKSKSKEVSKNIIIITLSQYGEKLTGLLRKLEFDKFEVSGISGKPEEFIRNSETRIHAIESEKETHFNELAVVADEWKDNLLVLKEQLEVEKERDEIFSSFGETNNTMMFEAWVPEKKMKKSLEILETSTEGHSVVEVSDPEENDDVPSHLDNPRFAKPYEMMVDMYSPTNYKELDPTIFMAIMFPFFFGYCLTDAGYGIIDALVGYLLYRGLGRTNRTMHDMGLILVACGVWAFILGMVTNGFIGDLVPRFIVGDMSYLMPTVIGSVNAFVHPENILYIALTIGILHINLGLIMGAYNNIKNGKIGEAFGTQLDWIILELAIVLYIVTGSAIVGGVTALIAIGIMMYYNGVMGVMDILSFLGTVLSYSRLLALCLSTGGIAMTVNIITGLSAEMIPYVGIILAPIIFIGGHIANLAFQSLGAFIHSLRLHYVEFFSQFYEGGSPKFKPFQAERKFTKIRR